MNRFQQSLHHLMSGGVICPVATPRLFEYLTEEGGGERLRDHLEMAGWTIAQSAGGKAFYMVWSEDMDESRQAIRRLARPLYDECVKVGMFVDFMLNLDDSRGAITTGTLIRAADISRAIDRSTALRDGLGALSAALATRGTTDHARIGSILLKLTDLGYLHPVNKEREEYEVTAKIEIFQDMLTYFISQVGALARAADEAIQQRLL